MSISKTVVWDDSETDLQARFDEAKGRLGIIMGEQTLVLSAAEIVSLRALLEEVTTHLTES